MIRVIFLFFSVQDQTECQRVENVEAKRLKTILKWSQRWECLVSGALARHEALTTQSIDLIFFPSFSLFFRHTTKQNASAPRKRKRSA